MSDSLSELLTRVSDWVDESKHDLILLDEFPSMEIKLYSDDLHSFGAVSHDHICTKGQIQCIGTSSPTQGKKALFHITCGNASYVGSDMYFFSPHKSSDQDPIRAYVCADQPKIRPSWTLLGYFSEGECEALQSATLDDEYCEDEVCANWSFQNNTCLFLFVPTYYRIIRSRRFDVSRYPLYPDVLKGYTK